MLAIDTNVLPANVALIEALLRLTGKRYALGKPELCKVIKALIEELSLVFEDSQAVWIALNDYENDMRVHGKTLDPFLDFYPIQIEALKALIKAVHKATGIKLAAPTTTTTSRPAVLAKIDGVINHYHLTKNKIDCANIDLPKLIKEIS